MKLESSIFGMISVHPEAIFTAKYCPGKMHMKGGNPASDLKPNYDGQVTPFSYSRSHE